VLELERRLLGQEVFVYQIENVEAATGAEAAQLNLPIDGFDCSFDEAGIAAKTLVKATSTPNFGGAVASKTSALAMNEVRCVAVRTKKARPIIFVSVVVGGSGRLIPLRLLSVRQTRLAAQGPRACWRSSCANLVPTSAGLSPLHLARRVFYNSGHCLAAISICSSA
jgi:hypothetical protein